MSSPLFYAEKGGQILPNLALCHQNIILGGGTHIWKWYICAAQSLKKGGGLREWPPLKMGGFSERCLSEK